VVGHGGCHGGSNVVDHHDIDIDDVDFNANRAVIDSLGALVAGARGLRVNVDGRGCSVIDARRNTASGGHHVNRRCRVRGDNWRCAFGDNDCFGDGSWSSGEGDIGGEDDVRDIQLGRS